MRSTHSLLVAFGLLVVNADAHATTKAQSSLVPVGAACVSGTCNNRRGACSVTADCVVGTLARTSKLGVDGRMRVTVSARGVTDALGAPVTTDGVLGSPNDHILKVCFTAFLPARTESCVYLHLDLSDGKGRLAFVGTPLAGLFPPASAVELTGTELLAPPRDPARCPGNNATGD